ncbi:MAG TPA: universal stress protein [Cyclobacteriaceae bacterium]
MKKILVPTDFSVLAQAATDVAVDMAKKMNAEIVLLHVIEQPSSSSFNVTGEANYYGEGENKLFTLKLIQKSKGQLTDAIETVKLRGVKAKGELRMGNPFHGIRAVIEDHKTDLIIMGTEGRSKLDSMIIGSNTEKVIRHSVCPVLTINKRSKTVNFKNIVYATSLLGGEEKFVKVVSEIQEYFKSKLHLVWINTPAVFQPDLVVRKTLQDFASKQKLKNFSISIFNDYSPEEGIIHFADSIHADAIAMATHGRTGFAHVLVGSISEEVAKHAHRPVITFLVK